MPPLNNEPLSDFQHPELSEKQKVKAAQLIAHCIPYRPGEDREVNDEDGELIDFLLHNRFYQPGDETLIVSAMSENGLDPLWFSHQLATQYQLAGSPQTELSMSQTNREAAYLWSNLSCLMNYLTLDHELRNQVQSQNLPLDQVFDQRNPENGSLIDRHPYENNVFANIIMTQALPQYQNAEFAKLHEQAQHIQQLDQQRKELSTTENDIELDKEYLTARIQLAIDSIKYYLNPPDSSSPVPSPALDLAS